MCKYINNLEPADENGKAAVGLKGSHVKVGDEVHNTHCSCHKCDLVLFITQEFYYLQSKKNKIKERLKYFEKKTV